MEDALQHRQPVSLAIDQDDARGIAGVVRTLGRQFPASPESLPGPGRIRVGNAIVQGGQDGARLKDLRQESGIAALVEPIAQALQLGQHEGPTELGGMTEALNLP